MKKIQVDENDESYQMKLQRVSTIILIHNLKRLDINHLAMQSHAFISRVYKIYFVYVS